MMMTTTRLLLCAAVVIGGCAFLPSWVFAQDALGAQLRGCASLDAEDERMRCYDALARQETSEEKDAEAPAVSAEPSESPPVAQEPATEETTETVKAVAINDEVGREQVQRDNEAEDVEYRAKVTSCKKNSSGQVFFFLENGQIWKQKDFAKLRYVNCDFDVTMTKDMIGYKMKIVGKKSSFRVSRVK